jgi:high-affinity iron transporter
MIFWMRRQSRLVKGHLEPRVDSALRAENIGLALAGVALVAVLREGIEPRCSCSSGRRRRLRPAPR